MKDVWDVQNQSIEAAEDSDKRATEAVAHLAKFFLRIMEVEELVKVVTDKLTGMQRQVARSAKAPDDAHKRFGKALRSVTQLGKLAQVMKLQPGKMGKARDLEVADSNSRWREVKVLEARLHMLCNELDSLKRYESASCDLEVIAHKAVNAQCNTTNLVIELRRNTVRPDDVFCRCADAALVEVIRCVMEAFNWEARSVQQGVRDAVYAAAEETYDSFVGAPGAIDMSLGVIAERAAFTGGSAVPEASLSPTAIQDAHAAASRNLPWSTTIPPIRSLLNSSGAHDSCDHPGGGT